MSFFSGLRGMMSGGKPGLPEHWNIPENESDIDQILKSGIHVIYKHSFTCATCMFAKMRVEEVIEDFSTKASFHFIDVRQNRALSNLIAQQTGVRHESPQLLVIKEGEVFWHASHGAIQSDKLIECLS